MMSDKILDTSYVLFLTNGIKGTSMDDIARINNISKKTLYQQFKSKEKLAIKTVKYSMNKI